MSSKIYSYTKLTELENAPFYKEIAGIPQITMSREVSSQMGYHIRIFRGNIYDFSSFSSRLFQGWNSGGQKFSYSVELNKLLRDKLDKARNKAERDWLYGCKKNIYAAIGNILRLEESGITPDMVPADDRDLKLLVEMWRHLELADDGIKSFRARRMELQKTENFDKAVHSVFKFHGSKRIIWHGFLFYTPLQQFIYDCFVRSGYQVDALICDDERYPYANEIWNNLYSVKKGYLDRSQWIRQVNTSRTNFIGEIFESRKPPVCENIKIIKYDNTVDFIDDIIRIKKNGYYLYSADDTTANSILRDYYPELYEVRNLLAYPIGQFIYSLHKMWDEKRQSIVMDPDNLRKCFASGWLAANSKSSTNYTDDLEKLLPYFSGCEMIEDWNERKQILLEQYQGIQSVFESDKPQNRKEYLKLQGMENPLKFFSEFSLDKKRIDEVLDIINQLTKMAQTLFSDNEPVSIHEHLSKLDSLLYMNDGMPKELFLEERQKVEQIFKVLESDKVKDFLCYPGDLASAIMSFMEGMVDEEEEKLTNLHNLVFNLFQVEASPFASKGKVHICLSDINRLPGAVGKINWPLDEETLQKIRARAKESYINNWIEQLHINVLTNRYYVYKAMENEHVEISWIHQQGEKVLSPSPYITLLSRMGGLITYKVSERSLTQEDVMKIPLQKKKDTSFDINRMKDYHSYDKELEYALCPRRYLYSGILEDSASYRNDYQQGRAVVRFIQVLDKLVGSEYDIEEIAEQVFEFFPYIRKAEKRQILDDAKKWHLKDDFDTFTTVGDHKITDARLALLFPDQDVYENARKFAAMLMSQDGRKGIWGDRWGGENKSRNCETCPHQSYCLESYFGLDYVKEGS